MTGALNVYWFLPTHGDGRTISRRAGDAPPGADEAGSRTVQRAPDLTYLAQVCGAVEQLGFAGMLVPAGMFCEDPWLVSVALAQRSSRVRFMVAMRPSLLSPTLAAQMAATAQRLTGNRLLLNVVTGGDPQEQGRYGSWLEHDQRYAQTAEFVDIMRQAWTGRPTDRDGAHFRVRSALVTRPPQVTPPVFVGGSSAAAQRVAAEFGEVYLAWGEGPEAIAGLFASVAGQAAGRGRELAFGTRFHVISRDTSEQAWVVADQLVADLDPATVRAAQARSARSDSEGQRRMAGLHGGRVDQLLIHPQIWTGYGLLRPGAGAALVGSHQEVADVIEEYYRLGVRHLILSGQPHLEEAYWFGEGVLPLLRSRGLLADGGRPA